MFLISTRPHMVSGTFLPILGMFLLAFPVILRTDASDYGYGAYLCQIVGERGEYPVLFMSKSFHCAELN